MTLDPRSGPTFRCCQHRDVGARAVRLEFVGELDMATRPAAEHALRDALEGDDLALIVVDLRGLTFLGSSGLHLLLETDERLRDAGVRLAIVQGDARIRRIFEITGTETRLPIVGNPPERAATLARRPLLRSADELRARDRVGDSPFISARARPSAPQRRQ
jgi:anti-sigma B factor antagonist